MSAFSAAELSYLRADRRLGRLATVGEDGTPHVVPVGWTYNAEHDSIDVGGRDFAHTKKFRDVARSGRAAIVVDDLASVDPWHPRAVEVRGRAEAIAEPRRSRHTLAVALEAGQAQALPCEGVGQRHSPRQRV